MNTKFDLRKYEANSYGQIVAWEIMDKGISWGCDGLTYDEARKIATAQITDFYRKWGRTGGMRWKGCRDEGYMEVIARSGSHTLELYMHAYDLESEVKG